MDLSGVDMDRHCLTVQLWRLSLFTAILCSVFSAITFHHSYSSGLARPDIPMAIPTVVICVLVSYALIAAQYALVFTHADTRRIRQVNIISVIVVLAICAGVIFCTIIDFLSAPLASRTMHASIYLPIIFAHVMGCGASALCCHHALSTLASADETDGDEPSCAALVHLDDNYSAKETSPQVWTAEPTSGWAWKSADEAAQGSPGDDASSWDPHLPYDGDLPDESESHHS